MRTIAFINHKGGVGKSTICAHLAYSLAHKHKRRVLAVDFDTQANLTEILGAMEARETITDLLRGAAPASCVFDANGVAVLPASMELANVEYELTASNTQNALKTALESLKEQYDYVLIDCPPSLGMLTINALMAATDICVVSNAEYLSLRGMTNIVEVVEQIQMYNRELNLSSVVVSHYDARKGVNREVLAELQKTFDKRVIMPPIRSAVAVVEASSHGGTVFQIRPNADVTNDFFQLSEAFLKHYE